MAAGCGPFRSCHGEGWGPTLRQVLSKARRFRLWAFFFGVRLWAFFFRTPLGLFFGVRLWAFFFGVRLWAFFFGVRLWAFFSACASGPFFCWHSPLLNPRILLLVVIHRPSGFRYRLKSRR
jgi:hypothetical protein